MTKAARGSLELRDETLRDQSALASRLPRAEPDGLSKIQMEMTLYLDFCPHIKDISDMQVKKKNFFFYFLFRKILERVLQNKEINGEGRGARKRDLK